MKSLILFQGLYFLVTGIWPVVHVKRVLALDGYNSEIRTVKIVGLFVTSISLSLLIAFLTTINLSIIVLAFFGAFAVMVIDLYYSAKSRISNGYLLDAAVEFFILIALSYLYFQEKA